MNLLLDTHALLWWLDNNPKLSKKSQAAISNADNMVFISAAVIWEITIKKALGKLEITDNFFEILEEERFLHLDISARHARTVGDLPYHHQDPFDRMLTAQAKVEGLTLVTRDKNIMKYDVSIIAA